MGGWGGWTLHSSRDTKNNDIMHLSMLSPRGGGGGGGRATHGALTVRSVSNPNPPQVVRESPWEQGCLKITLPSWKIPRRRSKDLPTFVRGH